MASGKPATPASDDGRRSTVQSVERAFEILAVLQQATAPMSALEIAGATGLDRTVVHRLLRTIARSDMVIEERGTFRLGPTTVLLANRYLDNLLVRRLALPYLLDLQVTILKDSPWNVSLSIPVGAVSTVIERMWSQNIPLGVVLDIGDFFPIDRSATGRSILAYYEEKEVLALIGEERYEKVKPRLEETRKANGVALSHGEAIPGVNAVAAVILSRRSRPVAAIGISGLDLDDGHEYRSSLADHLRRAADAVGQSIP